jgi:hypothetical protein
MVLCPKNGRKKKDPVNDQANEGSAYLFYFHLQHCPAAIALMHNQFTPDLHPIQRNVAATQELPVS